MYMIKSFEEAHQAKLNMFNMERQAAKAKAVTTAGEPGFDEILTKWINAMEIRVSNNNVLTTFVINKDFDSSMIIMSP